MHSETPHTQPPRERKRNTAIMLSVITCLFMGIMGYEIIRNEPAAPIAPLVAKPKIFLERVETEVTENLPLKVLHSQNRLQAQKIKSLKTDLDLMAQRLHDFQLSTQSAVKAVESKKVQELETQLTQNAQANEQLKSSISNLQEELELMDQKSMTMEQTIDSLIGMIDAHKLKQERSVEGFSKKIENLQNAFLVEKEEFVRNVQSLENSQSLLKTEVEEHFAEIVHLEEELVKNTTMLAEKEEEILSLSTAYHALKTEMSQQENLLATQIDADRVIQSALVSNLDEKEQQVLSMQQQIETYTQQVAILEADLDTSKDQLTLKDAEIQTLSVSKMEITEQIEEMKILYELELAKKELFTAESSQQQELIISLQNDLSILTEKHLLTASELTALQEDKTIELKNVFELQEQIDLLAQTLKTKELDFANAQEAFNKLLDEKSNDLGILLEKSTQVTNDLDSEKELRQILETQIAELTVSHAQIIDEMTAKDLAYQENLQKKTEILQELEEKISTITEAVALEAKNISELEEKNSFLKDELRLKESELARVLESTDQIYKQNLETIVTLEKQIVDSSSQFEDERKNHSEAQEKIVLQNDLLIQKESEIAFSQAKIIELNQELALLTEKFNDNSIAWSIEQNLRTRLENEHAEFIEKQIALDQTLAQFQEASQAALNEKQNEILTLQEESNQIIAQLEAEKEMHSALEMQLADLAEKQIVLEQTLAQTQEASKEVVEQKRDELLQLKEESSLTSALLEVERATRSTLELQFADLAEKQIVLERTLAQTQEASKEVLEQKRDELLQLQEESSLTLALLEAERATRSTLELQLADLAEKQIVLEQVLAQTQEASKEVVEQKRDELLQLQEESSKALTQLQIERETRSTLELQLADLAEKQIVLEQTLAQTQEASKEVVEQKRDELLQLQEESSKALTQLETEKETRSELELQLAELSKKSKSLEQILAQTQEAAKEIVEQKREELSLLQEQMNVITNELKAETQLQENLKSDFLVLSEKYHLQTELFAQSEEINKQLLDQKNQEVIKLQESFALNLATLETERQYRLNLEEKISQLTGQPASSIDISNTQNTMDTTQQASVSVQPTVRNHIVTAGENLRTISRRYYGTTNRWKEIYAANRNVIRNRDNIKVGTSLVIPDN